MARRQLRPDSGLGFQTTVLKPSQVDSLRSGAAPDGGPERERTSQKASESEREIKRGRKRESERARERESERARERESERARARERERPDGHGASVVGKRLVVRQE